MMELLKRSSMFCLLVLMSCAKEVPEATPEDIYLRSNVPKIFSLEESDIDDFKRIMRLDKDGNLTSWDSDILMKAYNTDEDYEFIITYILSQLGETPKKIVTVDEDNNEKAFYPGFYDIDSVKQSLYEVQKWDALFYVTSTNCATCMSDYGKMNDLASKFKAKNIKFVAIFEKVKNIDNYKKGEIFKTDGFLSEEWVILQKNKLLPLLSEKYKDSLGVPYVFFRKEGSDLGVEIKHYNKEILEEFISVNF